VVLVAFVLVLAAAASFAAGIATSRTNDTLVYVSIILSVGAFVVLATAALRSRSAQPQRPEDAWASARREALERDIGATTDALGVDLDATQLDLGSTWTDDARSRWRSSVLNEVAGADVIDEIDQVEWVGGVPETFASAEPDLIEEEAAIIPDPEEEVVVGPHGDPLEDDALDVLETDADVELDDESLDPIDDYDDLTASEIIPELADLDLDDLQWVWARETTGGDRPAVLAEVERLMAGLGGEPTAATMATGAAAPPAKKPSAKKESTKKSSTKKSSAKKAAAKKSVAKNGAGERASRRASRRA